MTATTSFPFNRAPFYSILAEKVKSELEVIRGQTPSLIERIQAVLIRLALNGEDISKNHDIPIYFSGEDPVEPITREIHKSLSSMEHPLLSVNVAKLRFYAISYQGNDLIDFQFSVLY